MENPVLGDAVALRSIGEEKPFSRLTVTIDEPVEPALRLTGDVALIVKSAKDWEAVMNVDPGESSVWT